MATRRYNRRPIQVFNTSGIAYPCIIGSGENATILHYTVNNDTCDDGEIILLMQDVSTKDMLLISLGRGLMVNSQKQKQKSIRLYWMHNFQQ